MLGVLTVVERITVAGWWVSVQLGWVMLDASGMMIHCTRKTVGFLTVRKSLPNLFSWPVFIFLDFLRDLFFPSALYPIFLDSLKDLVGDLPREIGRSALLATADIRLIRGLYQLFTLKTFRALFKHWFLRMSGNTGYPTIAANKTPQIVGGYVEIVFFVAWKCSLRLSLMFDFQFRSFVCLHLWSKLLNIICTSITMILKKTPN